MSSMPPPPPPTPPPPPSAPPPGYIPYGTGAPAVSNFATFGARLGAYLIDAIVLAIFEVPAIIAILAGPREIRVCTINNEVSLCNVPTGSTIALSVGLGFIALLVWTVLYCKKVSTGQSWGQKVAGVRIVDAQTGTSISAGKVFVRQICRIFSQWICFLGYLWMLWDSRKQTWHDKMIGTVVVKA